MARDHATGVDDCCAVMFLVPGQALKGAGSAGVGFVMTLRRPGEYQTPPEFTSLVDCLKRVPAVNGPGLGSNNVIPGGYFPDRRWWVVFQIKTDDKLAWPVIRRLAEVFNDTSSPKAQETFPIIFKPVVPELIPPAPSSIWWSLETTRAGLSIGDVVEKMKSRLPQPIEDASRWL